MGPLPHDHHRAAVGYSHSLQAETAPGYTSTQAPRATTSSSPAGRTARAAAATVAATRTPGSMTTKELLAENTCIWCRALEEARRSLGSQKLLRACCLPFQGRVALAGATLNVRFSAIWNDNSQWLSFLLLFLSLFWKHKTLKSCLLCPPVSPESVLLSPYARVSSHISVFSGPKPWQPGKTQLVASLTIKTCLSLRIELAFKSKTEQAKQGVFRVFGKVYQPTCKYTYMALSVLKGIIEQFHVLAAATLHNRLPRRLKGFGKAFFVNVTSCNGIEVKLSELTPCTHIGICPCSSVCFACWVSVQSGPEARGWTQWRNRKTALTDFGGMRHTLPQADALLPRFCFTFHFLLYREQRTLWKSSDMKFYFQDLSGSHFPCNTKTQIIKDEFDPVHGENQGLGVLFCVLR